MKSTGKYQVPIFNLFKNDINVFIGNKDNTSENNRYQNALTICNVSLDSVVSDFLGASNPKKML